MPQIEQLPTTEVEALTEAREQTRRGQIAVLAERDRVNTIELQRPSLREKRTTRSSGTRSCDAPSHNSPKASRLEVLPSLNEGG